MKRNHLLLSIAVSFLFVGCPQKQNQTNGPLNLLTDFENLHKGAYTGYFSYTYEPSKKGLVELTILPDSGNVGEVKTFTFEFSNGNVRAAIPVEKDRKETEKYIILALADKTGQVIADIILEETPFEDTSSFHLVKQCIKTKIEATLFHVDPLDRRLTAEEPFAEFKGQSIRVISTRVKDIPIFKEKDSYPSYAPRSRRLVD